MIKDNKINIEEIKKGINIHFINTSKFKTNLFSVFVTVPLERETITKNALIAAVLRRGSKELPTQEDISKQLENMYGASFDCGVEKAGDNHIIKFYLECINDEFLPQNDMIFDKCLNTLLNIVFNPITKNNEFLEQYIEGEKENLKQIIERKIDNKMKYSVDRCIEEMYLNEPYGLFKYGYIEDLNNIDSKNLYEYYQELISNAKIDIFISGDLSDDKINNIKTNSIIQNLESREPKYIVNKMNEKTSKNESEPRIVEQKMQVTQGKLILGLDVLVNETDLNKRYAVSIYNIILGGSANSKLFQNVREKASLAYTASSNYIRQKNNIIIKSGIEIDNYEKAVKLIKEQLEQIEKGKFSEEDIENSKKLIISTVESIPENQDSEITYYLNQELSKEYVGIQEYLKNISEVTKEDVIDVAKTIKINTIYFLRN